VEINYSHESRGTRNQEALCWLGTAVIYQSVSQLSKIQPWGVSRQSPSSKDMNGEAEESMYILDSHYQATTEDIEGSGIHPTSYPMGTGGSFPGGKSAGA
jgi:hypothetical protein